MSKEIPHYINDPVINKITAPEKNLYRPKIYFGRAFLITITTIIGTLLLSWGITFLLQDNESYGFGDGVTFFLSVYWKVQIVVLCLVLKYILIWFIKVYQRYAKSETRLRCCYVPSCSEYAILALKKYGLVIGSFKAVNRLLRCGPPGGVDYP